MYRKPYILKLKLCHYLGESFFFSKPRSLRSLRSLLSSSSSSGLPVPLARSAGYGGSSGSTLPRKGAGDVVWGLRFCLFGFGFGVWVCGLGLRRLRISGFQPRA